MTWGISRHENEGLTNPEIRFEGRSPLELSAEATEILKAAKNTKAHGAVDGWLTPWQLGERRRRELSASSIAIEGGEPWLNTFQEPFWFKRPKPRGRKPRQEMPHEKCPIEGCDNDSRFKRGLCAHHDRKKRKWGDPLAGPPPRIPRDGPCRADGCDQMIGSGARGLCRLHYSRFIKATKKAS